MLKTMLKCTVGAAAVMMLSSGIASASPFLMDWQIDTTGTGASKVGVHEYLDTVGNSYIKNNLTGPTTFNFDDWGFFRSSTADGGTDVSASGLEELTGIFHGTGHGTLGGGISFYSGGYLDIYVGAGATKNYGQITSTTTPGVYFGANDGTKIASFTVFSGGGVVDPTGVPNGDLTLTLISTFLKGGYFYDNAGNDLSTSIDPISFLLGFATTNASYINPPSVKLSTEIQAFTGFGLGNTPPFELYVSNNGQYRLAEVPEPSTLLLLGGGLMGLAIYRKRKSA